MLNISRNPRINCLPKTLEIAYVYSLIINPNYIMSNSTGRIKGCNFKCLCLPLDSSLVCDARLVRVWPDRQLGLLLVILVLPDELTIPGQTHILALVLLTTVIADRVVGALDVSITPDYWH